MIPRWLIMFKGGVVVFFSFFFLRYLIALLLSYLKVVEPIPSPMKGKALARLVLVTQ